MRGLDANSPSATRAHEKDNVTLVKKDSLTLEGRVTVPRFKKVLSVKELMTDKTTLPEDTVRVHNLGLSPRNPITGEGCPQGKHQPMYSTNRKKDGNPLLGIGYGKNVKQTHF